jgi:hypothetical protein
MKKILLIMAASFIMFAALPFSAFAAIVTATSYFEMAKGTEYIFAPEIKVGDVVEIRYTPEYDGIAYGSMWVNNRQLPYPNTKTNVVVTTTIQASDLTYDSRLILRKYTGNVYNRLRNVAVNGVEVFNADTSPTPSIRPFEKIGVTDLAYTTKSTSGNYSSVTLTWTNPTIWQFNAIQWYQDDAYKNNLSQEKTLTITNLLPNKTYKIGIKANYVDSTNVMKEITVTTAPPPPLAELTGVTASPSEESILLSWIKPTHIDFQQVNIYKDGIKIGQSTGSSYADLNLTPGTAYSYSLKVLSKQGAESAGVAAVATTLKPSPVGEVTILSADPSYNQVELTWKLPSSINLQHVNLYRDGVKIGETSGSSYIDLTAEPETTYTYTMTTTSKYGAESEGVSRTVTTLKAPIPAIVGGGYEKDPLTGNFIYYWDEPTTGKVKILVGGSLYKTVEAADKQITIPKNEMKYTAFGDPAVSLIPVGIDGKEGAAVKPPLDGVGSADSIENVKVPFTANDLLGSGVGLLWFIAPILLLVLSFLVVPKLRRMLFSIFTKNRTEEGTRRFKDETSTGRESETKEQRKQREQREYRERKDKAEREKREQRERKERAERAQRAATGKEAILKIEKAPKVAKEPRVRREKVGRSERQQRQQRERSTRERTTRAERG